MKNVCILLLMAIIAMLPLSLPAYNVSQSEAITAVRQYRNNASDSCEYYVVTTDTIVTD